MARVATISVSLTPRQLRLVQERVASGGYESASEVIREGLSVLFNKSQSDVCKPSGRLRDQLAAGYRACASHDRKTAREWMGLSEAWPEE